MRPLCIAVFFDALGDELYCRVRPPFLTSVEAEGGTRALEPSLGFCEYTAAFTGQHPSASGHLALYRFRRNSRAFGWLRWLGPARELVPRRVIDAVAARLEPDVELRGTSHIPRRVLAEVEVVEVRRSFWTRDSEAPNITRYADRRGLRVARVAGPSFWGSGTENLAHVVAKLRAGTDFVVVHVPDLDALAHRFGMEDHRVSERLLELDCTLGALVGDVRRGGRRCDVVAFGDHGMVSVRGRVATRPLLDALDSDIARGACTVFLDSTMARVRVWSADVAPTVRDALRRLPHGRVLSESQLRAWGAWFEDRSYGDEIFLADPGYVLHPNYFQGDADVAGMHGYAPGTERNRGRLVSSIPIPAMLPAVVPLRSVHRILRDWVDEAASVRLVT
jgi:hypothetical protein